MSLWWVVLAVAVLTFATYIQSRTGFGFAMFSAPVLLFGLDPRAAVVVLILLHSIQCALVLASEREFLGHRKLLPLVVGGALGTPGGALALKAFDAGPIHLGIGIAVVVSGVLLFLSSPRPLRAERSASVIAGLLSGLLNGGTGVGGPPVALYVSNQGWTRDQFRTALMATFLASNLVALAFFLAMGLVDHRTPLFVAVLAPAVLAGWLVYRIRGAAVAVVETASFRRLIGAMVIVAGLSTIARA